MQQAGLAQSLGQASTSLALFKNAYELEPRNTQARVTYANALLAADRTSDAVTLLQPIATTTAIVSADIAGMFTRAHAQDELTALWKTYLDAHTTDPQAYMTVAAAYYRAGDKESSIATLKQLARLVPAAASQIDTIIEQVRTNHLAQ
jgi:thioredoxin-like negative regulator of GroEL